MTSVELLFDAELERAVQDEWLLLEAAGVPNQSRHAGASNRPHVTLIWAESGVTPMPLPSPSLPLGVRLGAPILFGAGRRGVVLARLVVPSAGLLRLQSAIHDQQGSATGIASTTEPRAWTPHVTLSRAVPLDQLAVALGVLDLRRDLVGDAVAARHWDAPTATVTPLV